MANKIPLALERLVHSIQSGKVLLHAKVYTTFLSYPDEIINANQKLLLIAFMQLGEASRLMDKVKGLDMQFQLNAKSIGTLTGLTANQANRALIDLPRAVNELARRKVYKKSEKIVFKLQDVSGQPIDKNGTGVAPYIYFEYTAPTDKIKFGAEYQKEKKIDPAKQDAPAGKLYDKSKDFQYNQKMEYLRKLKDYFTDNELEEFTSYKVIMIVKAVDYYLRSLEIKRHQHGNNAVLSLGWLRKAFTEYKIGMDPQKEILLESINYLRGLHDRIVKVVAAKGITHRFTFLHGKPPKYDVHNIDHIVKLQKLYHTAYEEMEESMREELESLTNVSYGILKKEFESRQIDEKTALYRTRSAILFRHLNYI